MVVYALSRQGRVESVNYRTTRVPSDVNIPEFVKGEFGKFYKATFAHALGRESGKALFTEYAWDMGWCDPCAAQPLSRDELQQLGVFWLDDNGYGSSYRPGPVPPRRPAVPTARGINVLLDALHVRYDADHFPEDLVFQETVRPKQLPGTLRPAACLYRQHGLLGSGELPQQSRRAPRKEAQTLADLTGWSMADIRQQMGSDAPPLGDPSWWKRLWK